MLKMSVLPCQRYKIESNSQPRTDSENFEDSRFYHVKDTKLKAIHNCPLKILKMLLVGFTMSKIQNWKQFTTQKLQYIWDYLSVLPCQRYKIESNSQQPASASVHYYSRFYHVKDTKLKAIHNASSLPQLDLQVGFTMSKIQNWKQFTTEICLPSLEILSVLPCQRYKIESNSQLTFRSGWRKRCRFYHVKDTKLKAIHNCLIEIVFFVEVGFTMSKIQNWKQFTTMPFEVPSNFSSVLPCQRYKIESNSQLIINYLLHRHRRFYHVKDTKLKAIHNSNLDSAIRGAVGFTMSKIQNWKQFTTCWTQRLRWWLSVLPCQRYKIESNSQPS